MEIAYEIVYRSPASKMTQQFVRQINHEPNKFHITLACKTIFGFETIPKCIPLDQLRLCYRSLFVMLPLVKANADSRDEGQINIRRDRDKIMQR